MVRERAKMAEVSEAAAAERGGGSARRGSSGGRNTEW